MTMSTICPKCRHVREPSASVPAWQCPACGVAYAKAADAALSPQAFTPQPRAGMASEKRRMPWRKLFILVLLVGGMWAGIQVAHNRHVGDSLGGDLFGGDVSTEQMRTLASTVKAEEVVIYSTTECAYCAQAKSWLSQNGFAFTECNMSVEPHCEAEFRSYGGNGTPYLVVSRAGKTRHMKNGFDSDELLAALAP
jgi:glutaredoxin